MSEARMKEIVNKYTDILTKLTEINKEAKILRESKKEIEEEILDFMENQGLVNLKVGQETFSIKEKKKTKTFSKKTLVDNLLGFMDKNQVDNITSKLFIEEEEEVSKVITHSKKKI